MKFSAVSTPSFRQLCTVLAALCLLISAPVHAAANDDWYQVEILAFTYVTAEYPSNEEWPSDIELIYPLSSQPLGPPRDWLVVEDSDWHTPFDLAMTPVEPYQAMVTDYVRDRRQLLPDSVLLRVPTPYRELNISELDLHDRARRMRNSRNYRVLLLQGWRQPISAENTARSIAISGGTLRGDYPELQGSISLSAGRYLHVKASLWFNSDLPEVPEQLPPPRPPLLTTEEPWRFQVVLDGLDLTSLQVADKSQDGEVALVSGEQHHQDYQAMDTRDYPYRGAVLMQADRRMRSGEQHFIDHPMFGLLIKAERFNAGALPSGSNR